MQVFTRSKGFQCILELALITTPLPLVAADEALTHEKVSHAAGNKNEALRSGLTMHDFLEASDELYEMRRHINSLKEESDEYHAIKKRINSYAQKIVSSEMLFDYKDLPFKREIRSFCDALLSTATTLEEAQDSAVILQHFVFTNLSSDPILDYSRCLRRINARNIYFLNEDTFPNVALRLIKNNSFAIQTNFEKALEKLSTAEKGESLDNMRNIIILKNELQNQIANMRSKLTPYDGPFLEVEKWYKEQIEFVVYDRYSHIPLLMNNEAADFEQTKKWSEILRKELYAVRERPVLLRAYLDGLERQFAERDISLNSRINCYLTLGLIPTDRLEDDSLASFIEKRLKTESSAAAVCYGLAPAVLNLIIGDSRCRPSERGTYAWLEKASSWQHYAAENLVEIFDTDKGRNRGYCEKYSIELLIKNLIDDSSEGLLSKRAQRNIKKLRSGIVKAAQENLPSKRYADSFAAEREYIYMTKPDPWYGIGIGANSGNIHLIHKLIESRENIADALSR